MCISTTQQETYQAWKKKLILQKRQEAKQRARARIGILYGSSVLDKAGEKVNKINWVGTCSLLLCLVSTGNYSRLITAFVIIINVFGLSSFTNSARISNIEEDKKLVTVTTLKDEQYQAFLQTIHSSIEVKQYSKTMIQNMLPIRKSCQSWVYLYKVQINNSNPFYKIGYTTCKKRNIKRDLVNQGGFKDVKVELFFRLPAHRSIETKWLRATKNWQLAIPKRTGGIFTEYRLSSPQHLTGELLKLL